MTQLNQILYLSLLPLFLLLLLIRKFFFHPTAANTTTIPPIPGTYPIIGSISLIQTPKREIIDRLTTLLRSSPTSTIAIHAPLGTGIRLMTANPTIIEHILKTKFSTYPKGPRASTHLRDLLGGGIFNADGEDWRFQRQVASHEFSTKSLRKFVEQVVDAELYTRLIPILQSAADTGCVLDLQEILKRFAFDNICKIAFGYDPEFLLPSLPEAPFASAFEEAVALSSDRFRNFLPLIWKIKRVLNIGSERKLKKAVIQVRDFALSIVREKKKKQHVNGTSSDADLLSRFLKSGHNDEQFVTDIAISFILAGRDTTSAALTWFFWLLTKNPEIEERIVTEIKSIDENQRSSTSTSYDEAKRDLIYTQAALFESMRLYPPVPIDSKQAAEDDIWPDGTRVKAGTVVAFHVYAMGRMERIWGVDWAEFKPERWLEKREDGKVVFVGRDPFSYPVFLAGPRICLGKEMAILQMKRVAGGILRRFKVVQAHEGGYEPAFLPRLTAIMEGGFPVRFEKRE